MKSTQHSPEIISEALIFSCQATFDSRYTVDITVKNVISDILSK